MSPDSPGQHNTPPGRGNHWSYTPHCPASHRQDPGVPGSGSRRREPCCLHIVLEDTLGTGGDRLLRDCTARTCCSLNNSFDFSSLSAFNWQGLTVLVDVIVRAGLISQVELAVWHQATIVLTLREAVIYLTSAKLWTSLSPDFN